MKTCVASAFCYCFVSCLKSAFWDNISIVLLLLKEGVTLQLIVIYLKLLFGWTQVHETSGVLGPWFKHHKRDVYC